MLMNDWLIQQGIVNPQMGLIVGLLLGLLATVVFSWIASRKSGQSIAARFQPEIDEMEARLEDSNNRLNQAEQENAVLSTRAADREEYYQDQIRKLEEAEKRLSENFERLAGKIF